MAIHDAADATPLSVEQAVAELLSRRHELTSVFQPIQEMRRNRVIGYEALLRLPAESAFKGASEAFAAAARTDRLVDLEIAALETHLRAAQALSMGRLFVNLSSRAFADERIGHQQLVGLVQAAGFPPSRVVLELTELVWIEDVVGLSRAVAPLREAGFLLAVDDFGAGFTNVQMLIELGPDFVKLDRSLVTGAAGHLRRRVFIESMAVLGRRINCSVVAEGVETPEDLAALRACGIECAQGWAIAAPQPLASLLAIAHLPVAPRLSDPLEECVGSFAAPQEGVSPDTPAEKLVALFDKNGELTAVPVLAGPRVVGLVTRALLFQHMGHRYGFALWANRPVAEFVSAAGQGFDRLPATVTADEAVDMVRRRPAARRFDPLVLETEDGAYHGLLPVDVLLTEVSRLKVEYALQSNPLTGLPGSLVFARVVESRIGSGQPFALGWVDIDDFKPFNDRYGFTRGDEVLQLLAQILSQRLGAAPTHFLAHPGGDDFAFLASPDGAHPLAVAAANDFSERVPALYDPPDREAGGISSVDRHGAQRRFGILSLSVGIVTWRGETGIDYRRLVEVAAEVKAAAKRSPGSAVVSNARDLTSGPWLPTPRGRNP